MKKREPIISSKRKVEQYQNVASLSSADSAESIYYIDPRFKEFSFTDFRD